MIALFQGELHRPVPLFASRTGSSLPIVATSAVPLFLALLVISHDDLHSQMTVAKTVVSFCHLTMTQVRYYKLLIMCA